ncbi:hypothetical protein ACPYO6_15870 [Georgenia sp. Z1344]|uniref:hypothetical protein n=1 Tax=Georgenia sp. Z1344 TaxID=3416706 RepID=UPI003CEF9BF9
MSEQPRPTPASVRGDDRLPADLAERDLDAQADALEALHGTLQARLAQDGG